MITEINEFHENCISPNSRNLNLLIAVGSLEEASFQKRAHYKMVILFLTVLHKLTGYPSDF